MRPVWTIVQKGRGILTNSANCFKQGDRETGSLKLFSQFADAQSMMHPFSNKVARFGILLRLSGRRFKCSG